MYWYYSRDGLDINKPCRGNNAIIKLDMTKAYDRIEWDFIFTVMKLFGFKECFIDLINKCLSNQFFSLWINGKMEGYFRGSRGSV